MFTLLIVVIAIALIFDLVNGFHDAANSIATVVSTKVLTPFQAVLWAASFNVIAFWVFDMSVGNTVAKTVDNGAIDLWVILAGLLAATAWNLFTWRLGIPSSSSHTLIGGFAGAAVAHAGFGVINYGEIIPVILFIFLAPLIGGVIAFIIAMVTVSRKFVLKFFMILGGTLGLYLLMNYMIEYMDMKPVMMYIVMAMMLIFILAYLYYMLVHGKKQTALKESNMYKKLQLLSSAAFSLGHGGADSQKVMGIICAALMVYGNLGREGKIDEKIGDQFQISEVMQIEYSNNEGKKEKFKPEFGTINGITYYADGDNLIDISNQEVIFEDEKLNTSYLNVSKFSSFENADKGLEKLHVYTKGKDVFDASTNELIFHDKEFNEKFSKAGMFTNYVSKAEIKKDYKIKTKVNSDTMPFWIAFGCYFMIGIGTLFGGWKIVKTMGSKITKVTPLEGVCAETAGALTLFTVSQMGIPVSTTHTITGSIIGVGATKRLSAVRWGVTINLLWAWVLTIPVSALFAAIFYYIICLFK
ncbi:MAG: inorganic phosphate transporter [Flavobacteriia bacterium]|nr:inorganic phosphate transporter [Flavobacteriia bacterium]